MRFYLYFLLALFTPIAYSAPVLGPNTAEGLIDTGLQSEPLMWLPFPLPYEVTRNSKSKDAKLLETLFKYKLVVREKSMTMEEVETVSETRKRLKLLWIYNYPDHRALEDQEGFYYGRGRLKKILDMTEPVEKGNSYFVQVHVQWYVDDMQAWIKDPAFRSARTLRRSVESFKKPFEKKVYLQYTNSRWRYWTPEPGASVYNW